MTLRTYRNFCCPNSHKGNEMTSENDQPYSRNWESVTVNGMKEIGKDERGYPTYKCELCGQPMSVV